MVVVAYLDALYTPDPTKQTQYRGVYRKGNQFVAMYKLAGRLRPLKAYPTEREAAERVAAEFQYWYGPSWHRRNLNERRANPWRAVRWHAPDEPEWVGDRGTVRGGTAARHAPPGWPEVGWAVEVWEWGSPVILGDHLHPTRPALDWPHRRRPWVWETEPQALDAFRQWRRRDLPQRWGLFACCSLWR